MMLLMWEFFIAPENLPFSIALGIMCLFAAIEGVGLLFGLGISSAIDSVFPDIDIDVDAPDMSADSTLINVLTWLRIGQVPALVAFIVLLTMFGGAGIVLQSTVEGVAGFYLPAWLASIPTAVFAFWSAHYVAGWISKILPQDETEAVSEESFIGRVATISLGVARAGSPAQARVTDQHGLTHYIMVEPDDGEEYSQGANVLIVKHATATTYKVVRADEILINK